MKKLTMAAVLAAVVAHGAQDAEEPLYLTHDNGEGVGRELQTAAVVKVIYRLCKSQTARGVQLLVFDSLARKSLAAGVDEPEVQLRKLVLI